MNLLVLFLAFVLATGVVAQENGAEKVIERDPRTLAEFHKIVVDAASQGAVRVRFPSGEWNWYCMCHLTLPEKPRFSDWSSNGLAEFKESLEKWLAANKVEAVHISMSPDLNPKTFFQVEGILRAHKVAYWIVKAKGEGARRNELRLVETDGRDVDASSLPKKPKANTLVAPRLPKK